MAILKDILQDIKVMQLRGSDATQVANVSIDSRMAGEKSCFIAVRGTLTDGHQFIPAAINQGASVIVCEVLPGELVSGVTYVQVENSAIAAAIIAHNFHGCPSNHLKLVGVTGTNGKTTVATLLFRLFTALGYHCGLISTVQNQIGTKTYPSLHTTPDPVSLSELLSQMYEDGCTYVFMEVSSHAIHQHRVDGLKFTGAIFTNITHDHLDYHKTFEEYLRVKKSFFDHLPAAAFAISNADDRRGLVMLQNTSAKKYLYSLKSVADFKGKILDNSLLGLHMIINDVEAHFRLIGAFNAYNLLAVFGAAICLGQQKEEVLEKLSTIQGAEGRFDYIISPKEKVIGIVDYAHTPDALLNVLATIKNLRHGNEKVITVVGCGGNRDKTKRPEMAAIACEYSDKVVFTSDNPRNEVPEDIIKDMEAGVPVTARKKTLSITDRREGIKAGVGFADAGDILLVAGKGHEKYQEVKGVRHHFDDKEVMAEMFQLLNK
ncbi:MAG TPA: UDP-N-acetylmuramoyl-L-alanyl-D-glutamate--2,6-diaminopimelate ligase [Ginsengibacter sp.]|nr:UDP-N-acetylmuramoyl-L-alanyl-D-glutamate--2,6-diaminopimelate ligase [Ginsengibacter sp.]HRP45829.1 UDP-N-acetylmuramoyl-L-alanyl-D-glutamate--2,6-diaminopimelate ligase [Ginsengibacter sp.]